VLYLTCATSAGHVELDATETGRQLAKHLHLCILVGGDGA
jgi:hypothetical protein